jgi:hypothetical protein
MAIRHVDQHDVPDGRGCVLVHVAAAKQISSAGIAGGTGVEGEYDLSLVWTAERIGADNPSLPR